MNLPETRPSLLIRVRDQEDRDAWDEFSEIYRPVIVRMARFKGMQPADCEDLAQQVLLSISKTIHNWQPDPGRAKFSTWVKRIAHNAILNAITRTAPDQATGNGDFDALCEENQIHSDADSELLRTEYRRSVFQWASNQIRNEFTQETWMSFWRTAVEGMDVDRAAKELGRTRGSVYASRSRVMRRLKQKVDDFCEEEQ